MEITFYPSFIKSFKKKIKNDKSLIIHFQEKLDIFKENPYDTRLKTHKLTGKLKDMYSFSISYDIRIIFSFYEKDKVIFEDVGTHDEVY
ncbi:MAG: plasmid stabilization protein [Ignavibacteria bacterium GWB2_35_12]|nr:MAG: plasmid stabilization protein [Ignavibacteria bacterium GWB2_35_12]OGV20661.1 MAG: plasmid stabilization protein [Ignavibacteria bacterium RIFOXYC2_FULL_35_21]